MIRVAGFILIISIFNVQQLFAATKVGTAVVNGETVYLYSDFSWKYSNTFEKNSCEMVNNLIEVCKKGIWLRDRSFKSKDPTQLAQFVTDDGSFYSMIIEEKIGISDGVSLNLLQEGVVTNFADGLGLDIADVPVIRSEDKSFADYDAKYIALKGDYKGLNMVMVNTFFAIDTHNFQLVTWTVGKLLTEKIEKLHQQFIKTIQVVQ